MRGGWRGRRKWQGYGRGYVQLTWKNNYLTLGKALGLGDDLAKNPDHVLDPDIAYEIMSYGMRNGSFSKGQRCQGI